MKTRLYIILLTVLSLLFTACKDSSTDPDPPGDTGNYLPGGIGTYYKYDLERQDSTGTTQQGQRSTTYTGTTNLNGNTYMVQTDTIFVQGINSTSVTYFRKTDSGVFYFLDTAGLSSTIPDSLLQYVSFDTEIRAFTFPLPDAMPWSVFKMNLNYIVTLTIIDVQANIEGKENITINLTSGNITSEAVKVRYLLTLRIPDPQNPFNIRTTTFTAFSWVVKDIGVARWEGNAAVLGAFTGTGIDLGDSTTTVSQNLIQYSIK